MLTAWGRRLASRHSQAWRAYGRPLATTSMIEDVVAHATRSYASRVAVAGQIRRCLSRPVASVLDPDVRAIVSRLPELDPGATTWLVHTRPTQRLVVHELAGSGELLSVVKFGGRDDPGLHREAAVLSALAPNSSLCSEHRVSLAVPELLAVSRDEAGLALRTRLNLSGLKKPPYAWTNAVLGRLAEVIKTLRGLLAARCSLSPRTDSSAWAAAETIRGEGGAPGHGDFTPWNLFFLDAALDVKVAVIDFEETGIWPTWWDGARLLATAVTEGRIRRSRVGFAVEKLGLHRHELLEYVETQRRMQSTQPPTPQVRHSGSVVPGWLLDERMWDRIDAAKRRRE